MLEGTVCWASGSYARNRTGATDPLQPDAIYRSSDRPTSLTGRSPLSTRASEPYDSSRSGGRLAPRRLTGSFQPSTPRAVDPLQTSFPADKQP